MTAPADRAPGAPRPLPARWPWLVAPPLAWALHEVVSYAGASLACPAGGAEAAPRPFGAPLPNIVVATLSLVALATAAVATARLWRWWRAQPRDPADGEGGPPAGRLRFVALVAAVLGTLCTYGVLLAATATFLRGCP